MFDESVYQRLKLGLSCEFPDDYLNYLRNYTGEEPEPNSFWVVEDDWGSGVDKFYVMAESDQHQSMLVALNWEGRPLMSGLVPIGGDGCFGYILMSVRPEDHGTIHYCCEWSDDGKTEILGYQGFWKIADDFTSFITRLGEVPDEDEDEYEDE